MNQQYPGKLFLPTTTKSLGVTVSLREEKLILTSVSGEHFEVQVSTILKVEKKKGYYNIWYGIPKNVYILQVTDEALLKWIKKTGGNFKYKKESKGIYYGLFLFITFLICLALLSYFFVLPLLVDQAVRIFPKSKEIAIGEQLFKLYTRSFPKEEQKTALVEQFCRQIKINTDYPIQITVVGSEVKNAFALPGGHIVIFSGILEGMKDPSQLAALLSHETGHVEKRHSLKLLIRNVSLGMIISAVLNDYGSLSSILISKGSELEQLTYNRAAEEEADEFAFLTLKNNNINPYGIVNLFKYLQKEADPDHGIPEFLMTHPKIDTRIITIQKRIGKEPYSIITNDSLQAIWQKLMVH